MRYLVTGAAGFIGSAVVSRLLSERHLVVGVDNYNETLYPAASRRARIAELEVDSHFSMIECDIAEPGSLSSLLGGEFDGIVHEAAVPGLAPSWGAFGAYSRSNLEALHEVLQLMVHSNSTHLVLASTSSVYGTTCVGDERTQLKPVSPYGVTKLAAEHLVNAYQEVHGVSATILRYFSVYGPRQRPDMAYARFCDLMLQGRSIPITGDGRQTRSMTYIDDIVDATVRALYQRPGKEVLNVCGDEEISVLEVVEILADELGLRPALEHHQPRPGDQVRTRGDASRAKDVLGWAPQTDVSSGLRNQARFALKNAMLPR